MTYTDTQLKQALAKMLPDRIVFLDESHLQWDTFESQYKVLDTELLHLCWLVEEGLTPYSDYWRFIPGAHATWQQRVVALVQVKGVAIV